MAFVISSHMSYAWSKGALNYCTRSVRVGKPERGSMEVIILQKTLLKPFAHQTNVTSSEEYKHCNGGTGVEGTANTLTI